MGLYDRNSMHEDPEEQRERRGRKEEITRPRMAPGSKLTSSKPGREVTGKHVVVAAGQLFLTFFAMLFSLRIPLPVFGKLILALVVLFFGIRWILLTYRRSS